jgi:DNA-binding LytR/AlgR family response regulator
MTSKPLCIIVDDEDDQIEALRDMIEEIDLLKVEKVFNDPDRFLFMLNDLKADIIFLDIEMYMSGVEIANKLQDKKVVFVSGHTERAIETYDVNAVDFVPKPLRINRLKIAIEKVLKHLPKNDKLVLRTAQFKKQEISFGDIICVKSNVIDARDKDIYLSNSDKLTAKNVTFDNLLSELPEHIIQINKSTVVNVDKVTMLSKTREVSLGIKELEKLDFSISDSFQEEFFKLKPHFR